MALTDNLISFYEMEANGNDSVVASANNLTNNAGITFTAGKVGNAATFNGTTQYFSIADNPSLSLGGVASTFSFWVLFNSITVGQRILVKDDLGVNREFSITFDPTFNYIVFRTFTGASGAGSVIAGSGSNSITSSGVWYFVVVQNDQTNSKLSINNGSLVSTAASNAGWNGAAPFEIGRQINNTLFLNGKLDQVGFWKRALSPAEITQLYNSGNGLSYAAMVGSSSLTLSTSEDNSVNWGETAVVMAQAAPSTMRLDNWEGGNIYASPWIFRNRRR